MTVTRLSWCERIDGPNWKQGYTGIPTRTLGNIKGEVKHSAEGSYAALLAALNNPSRIASWHFSVSKSGHVAQHYPLESVCWHAGDKRANIRYVGIEHEGRVGEPLTTAQVLATVHISLDIRKFAGLTALPATRVNLWEHNWISATACPSNRIPWALIINKIIAEERPVVPPPEEDEEMSVLVRATGEREVYAFNGSQFEHIPGGSFATAVYGIGWPNDVINVSDKSDPLHPHGNAKLPVYYPRGH